MQDKYEVLGQYFGYKAFRKGQEALIDTILGGRDALGIMPTGAGKSLCFQIPALLFEGISIVVSPLISLMKDQVNALTQSGVRAAYLNSSLTRTQYDTALRNAQNGVYKIIYVAPERLLTESFLSFAQNAGIAMVTIDEAHCVSQWGQDFRPGYLDIAQFIGALPRRPVVCAFTATATERVRDDIVRLLGLRDPFIQLTGFDRENLYFEVRQCKDKLGTLRSILKNMEAKSGIIYCSTRKNVEEVCERLCRDGYPATRYHAGLDDRERKRNQDAFLYDERPVMVATNAFGMGIDKSNVAYVIHYNMPMNLEGYYQEAGRAGRDGEAAFCILLYSGQDVITNQFLLEHAEENDQLDPETRARVLAANRERLKHMTFYCHTKECLRAYILRYFGETPPNFCGNCFNCNHHFEELDITVAAQKILCCVKRTGERYGVKLIVDTLRGSKAERVLRLGFDRQSTYGLLSDMKEHRVRDVIQHLVLEGGLTLTSDEYPVLKLGPGAPEILFGNKTLTMKLAREEEEKAPVRPATADARAGAAMHPALFHRLRELRARLADQQNLPAYVVFSNAALSDMCARMPQSREEFLLVSGVGQTKLERYGEDFLSVIREYLEETGTQPAVSSAAF